MRGAEKQQPVLFSYRPMETRIPAQHPLRPIRTMVNRVLTALSPRFNTMYAAHGRPSIPPEYLLRATVLQVLFSIRSERLLMDQLDYNLLYRWFVGLGLDDPVWDASTFSKNQERLLATEVAEAFLQEVLATAETAGLLSHEHFTVDGTLVAAWASQKSVRPKAEAAPPPATDGDPKNPTVDFRGERRRNATHASRTDPDARLARKGEQTGATLAHVGSVTMDNRHGLIVATDVRPPSGIAEREAALEMLTTLEPPGASPPTCRRTVGADKGYDQRAFVEAARTAGFTPHVAQNAHARHPSAVDARTTRHPGYAVSQRKRKLVEQAFGWAKEVGGLRRLKYRGTARVRWHFTFRMAIYNLVRLRTLGCGVV